MYLKSIEIHGFKSFANRINFQFHNGITAIVGPNGSGKSNVADAVRWVLGEQRVKQLRGGSMQDVIFAGTELRKPLGYAYVAITLDNSDHVLNIDYDEVTVSRRLYRSGESEYKINGNTCRLRDINELFLDTGIGKEGYSIIGQGQIEQILSSKPEDRRNLFDEAAGIAKFKLSKAETLKKLESEKNNLVRLNDILSELEKQIGPLEKQSEVAKVYLQKKEELKKLDVNIFLLDNDRLRSQLKETAEKLEIATKDFQETNAQYDQVKAEYDRVAAELEQTEAEIENARNQMTEASVMKERLSGQVKLYEEQIRSSNMNDQHFQERVKAITDEIEEKNKEKEAVLAEKKKIDDDLALFQQKKEETDGELAGILEEIRKLNEEIEGHKNAILETLESRSGIKANIASLETQKQQANIRKAELTSRLVRAKSDESKQDETIKELKEAFAKINDEIRVMNEEVAAGEQKLGRFKQTLTEKDAKLREIQTHYHQEKSKLEALGNIAERYEGYGNSVKRVMEQKEKNPGIIGVVADIIKTEKKYETAIETALGGNIQNIVTDDEKTAKKMIEFLKEVRGGRATFLPLDSIKDSPEFKTPEVLKEKGAIGMACDLVKVEKKYSDVAKSQLGRIVVVDTVDNAFRIARKFHYSIRMVTLEGELLVPGGAISGGAFKGNSNLLGRRREMDELEAHVKQYAQQIQEIQQEIADTKEERNALRVSLETMRSNLQNKFIEQNTARMNVQREEEKKQEQEGSYQDLKAESEELEKKLADILEEEQASAQALTDSENFEKENSRLAEEKTEILQGLRSREVEANDKVAGAEKEVLRIRQKQEFQQENVDRINNEIGSKRNDLDEVLESRKANADDLEAKKRDLESIRATIDASADATTESEKILGEKQKLREELSGQQKNFFQRRDQLAEQQASLDKEVVRLSAQKEKFEGSLDGQIKYMWEEYQIGISEAMELRDPEMTDASSMRRQISSLKDGIRSLGSVNVNAIEDYRNLSERYNSLKVQHDDLIESEIQLRKIIEDLDENMRTQFTEQFYKINEEFNKVFKEMFGGGKGTLELVENEDVLEAGIRINAQPPGKKLVNMMQLSGGEKALTAIALLFAIQKLKPSPFCLLDEIEAALDENNVVRFAKYLHKLKYTQFIVITHRRGTMDSADRLYGITMQEKGVSALVSVNLIDKEITN